MRALLILIFLTGCSVARFYQGPAVSQELRKNETSLGLVVNQVESDFQQKANFVDNFHEKGKDPFIMKNLDMKLEEMKTHREIVIRTTDQIRKLNDHLLTKVEDKKKIREGDPAFKAIEDFADKKDEALSELLKEVANYKKSSEEFEQLAFFTKLVKR
ncbi:MAG: hypothetical protein ACJ76H_15640 [Bacteriovoracaceae bacterium]